VHNRDRLWEKNQPSSFGSSVPVFQKEPLKAVPDECQTPYDFHKLFLSDDFVDNLVTASRMYAVRKGRQDLPVKITNDSLRVSMAIMYLTGYLTPSNRKMYWEQREDCSNSFVKKAMSRNMFVDIIQHTYFVENVIPDKNDRFWKVRPLFNHLNKTAKEFVQHPERVCVDEGMVKYFGPHPLKQFIRGKPIRFGYKLWILATPTGELLAVQPYAGSATHIPDFGLGQGPNVVLGLSLQYGLLPGTKVCIDNLFTSMDLIDHMGAKGYGVTGTLRQNRIISIPLANKKDANKMKRGEMKAVYTKDSVVAVWKDNKPVYMASNCDAVEPVSQCKRYNRQEKGYVAIPQPLLINDYNRFMGGVDLFDNGTKNYAIVTRLRKWYWCLYTWFLSAIMMQAWRLYRAHMKQRHRLAVEAEQQEQEQHAFQPTSDAEKKEQEKERKRRRTGERKLEEMPLLEFTRQVVELTMKKHSDIWYSFPARCCPLRQLCQP
jgi:DNA excision repair protein ERCC-6